MSHSLKNFWDPLFLYRKIMFGLFFFFRPFLAWFLFFFFSSEKFTFTHSLGWKTCFFFPAAGKKKRVFHTLTRFLPKNPKKQTIPGKKKRYLCPERSLMAPRKAEFAGKRNIFYLKEFKYIFQSPITLTKHYLPFSQKKEIPSIL